MANHDQAAAIRPLTLAWVSQHLEVGERIVGTEALHGDITADVRRLTAAPGDGGTRPLVLRSFVDPFYLGHAKDWLNREAGPLTLLTGTGVPAPGLVAVDSTAAHCEYPSLLMTHLAGWTVLDDEGLVTHVPLLARQLVTIHALRPGDRPREYVALTTADTVVTPKGADAAAWAAAIDVIRKPTPPYEGRAIPAPGLPTHQRAVRRTARKSGRCPDHRRRRLGSDLLGPGGRSRCGSLLHQSRAAARPGVGSAVR